LNLTDVDCQEFLEKIRLFLYALARLVDLMPFIEPLAWRSEICLKLQKFSLLAATIVLNVTPGNDVMFVASQSLGTGGRGGIVAALGVIFGIIFHILALALGLSELLVYYPWAFHALKVGGVGYLVFLAYKAFKNGSKPMDVEAQPYAAPAKIFLRGTLTNVLNPKVVLFFLAFIPQFLNPRAGNVFLQVLILGACFLASGTTVNVGYALLFGTAFSRIKNSAKFQKWISRLTGMVFIGLAFKLLTIERKT
jgi:threonine/homoserine/homoserine lactone efflux protein